VKHVAAFTAALEQVAAIDHGAVDRRNAEQLLG
jgi:hypothetical protein